MSVDKVREWAEKVHASEWLTTKGLIPHENEDGFARMCHPDEAKRHFRPIIFAACLAYSAYLRGLTLAYEVALKAMEYLGIEPRCPKSSEETGTPDYEILYARLCAIEAWHSVMRGEK